MLPMKSGETVITNRLKKLIKKKRNDEVKAIIGEANPSELRGYKNSSLLHLVVFYQNDELAEFAIEAGCDVNAQDEFKNTPLMLVLLSTTTLNSYLVKLLLDADADIFLKNYRNEYPLSLILKHYANVPLEMLEWFLPIMDRTERFEDVIDAFIEAKCKLNVVVCMQTTEWTIAVLKRLETIETSDSRGGIDQALYAIDIPNMDVLLHYGFDISARIRYFFQKLLQLTTEAAWRNLRVVQAFAKHIGGWSIWNVSAISIMAKIFETADAKAINIFVEHEIPDNVQKFYDVDLMAHCGGNMNPDVIELMRRNFENIGKFPSPGLDKQSILHFAVKNGVCENVRNFIAYGIDPNIKDVNGRTPLFNALSLTHEVEEETRKECVVELLLNRADPQILDNYGLSVLNLYHPIDDWPVMQIVLQYLARFQFIKSLNQSIITVISSNVQLKIYYDECHAQLEDMKKYKCGGKLTVYKLILQKTLVTARNLRSNAEIEANEKCISNWNYYYYGRVLQKICYTLKIVNACKILIQDILCECLEILRPYQLIIDCILDTLLPHDYFKIIDSSDFTIIDKNILPILPHELNYN